MSASDTEWYDSNTEGTPAEYMVSILVGLSIVLAMFFLSLIMKKVIKECVTRRNKGNSDEAKLPEIRNISPQISNDVECVHSVPSRVYISSKRHGYIELPELEAGLSQSLSDIRCVTKQ